MAYTVWMRNVVYIADSVDMLSLLIRRSGLHRQNWRSMERKAMRQLRILFVEDNKNVRELTLCLLEGAGREVVACGSAEEAIAHFQRARFDVVITDISLPGMSGLDLVRQIRSADDDTWFIVASGYKLPQELQALGSRVHIVTKPFESEQLDEILDRVSTEMAQHTHGVTAH